MAEEAASTPAPASSNRLLAILYRVEGQDERRLVRTQLSGDSLAPDTLTGLLQADGVDTGRFRVRVFDEHFKGYMTVAEDPLVRELPTG